MEAETSLQEIEQIADKIITGAIEWKSKLLDIIKENSAKGAVVKFIPGPIKDTSVSDIFGYVSVNGKHLPESKNQKFRVVETVNAESIQIDMPDDALLSKTKTFQVDGKGPVDLLLPLQGNQAYISCNEKQVCLINHCGETVWKKDLLTSPESITFTHDSYLLLSSFRAMQIDYIVKGDNLKAFLSTSPLHPLGVCCLENGQLLVCLVEAFNFQVTFKSRRLVRKYSIQGSTLKDYELDNRDRLFTVPFRVAEGIDDRVCVIDCLTESSGQIVVLCKDGTTVFTFKGLNSAPFCPTDLCASKDGTVFVVNSDTGDILVLNDIGNCVYVVNSLKEIGGKAISVGMAPSGDLWIAYNKTSIGIFSVNEGHLRDVQAIEDDMTDTKF